MIQQSIKKKTTAVMAKEKQKWEKLMCSKFVPSVPMFQSVFGKMERGGGFRKKRVNFEIGTERGTTRHVKKSEYFIFEET